MPIGSVRQAVVEWEKADLTAQRLIVCRAVGMGSPSGQSSQRDNVEHRRLDRVAGLLHLIAHYVHHKSVRQRQWDVFCSTICNERR